MDDDDAGRTAMVRAIDDQVLTESDIVLTKRLGKTESEFEDLVSDEILAGIVKTRYKADLAGVPKGLRNKKFTERARAAIQAAGRPWNEGTKLTLKQAVAAKCEELGLAAISPDRRGPLDTLAELIVERLGHPVAD